ncbi:hypothetical protein [Marinomonas colpomeniae]|jgi:hypothetical protein|uniref:Prepilin-type N-terminal cleavage/methylation domain-containing protein n=1 Tax=Marinomonas colpomeniae TaxID=2774408 RepID=A0ABR8NX55_9GAMM|nr:hypothetical protein [Marinomonas colpomeniae]MBD5770079.1 hypothetical protein [Marinomonas colpomeniae]
MTFRFLSNSSKKIQGKTLLLKRRLQGWMMMEVIICLALLAVVLHLVQSQSEVQWQSIQLAEEQRKISENKTKQQAMVQLTGSISWRDNSNITFNSGYPDCQLCRGNQLERWFYASQHINPDSDEGDE